MNETKPPKRGIGRELFPLLHLWPAALTLLLILALLPVTRPVLSALPERVEAAAQQEAAELPEAEEAAGMEELSAALEANYPDGVFTGSAQGYGGLITVQVTVEGGFITSIEILSADGETTSFFNRAMGVVEEVLTRQTWEVDVISGATYSSKGILGAIQAALTGESVETEVPKQETPTTALVTDSYEAPQNGYRDGTYYGSATGFGGEIQVEVVISGGKIASIRVVSAPGETASYLEQAKAVIRRAVAANSPNVDTVSGATYSSNGILNAVKRALAQAALGEPEDLTVVELPTEPEPEETTSPSESTQPEPPAESVEPSQTYRDGVYTGTAEGFGGEITVQVTIEGGKIVGVELLSAEDETPSYLKRASVLLSTIQTAQSTEVDVVSGATYSSNGILNAARFALAQAQAEEEPPSAEVVLPEETTPGPSSPSEEAPEEAPEPTPPEEEDSSTAGYSDGVYTAQLLCTDEEIFSYRLLVTVTVTDGKITQVAVEKGEDTSDDPESNDTFLGYAVDGRFRRNVWYEGVCSQILAKQSAEDIDVVSGATYSSRAIAEAVQQALNSTQEEDTP